MKFIKVRIKKNSKKINAKNFNCNVNKILRNFYPSSYQKRAEIGYDFRKTNCWLVQSEADLPVGTSPDF